MTHDNFDQNYQFFSQATQKKTYEIVGKQHERYKYYQHYFIFIQSKCSLKNYRFKMSSSY